MKKIFNLIASLSILFSACKLQYIIENEGTGPIAEKVYNDFKFNGIDQANSIQSEVYKSTENKIVVSAPSDIMEYIIVESKDGNQVSIHVKSNSNISAKKVRVKIYMKELQSIHASSASEVNLKDSFTQKELNISTSSGAEIKGYVSAMKLNVNTSSGSTIKIGANAVESIIQASSGSHITITGYTKTSEINVSSGAEVNAANFYSSESNLKASSGGIIDQSITQKVDANASSGGQIDVIKKGASIDIIKHESSGGEVYIK
jgi:hypothetical protein